MSCCEGEGYIGLHGERGDGSLLVHCGMMCVLTFRAKNYFDVLDTNPCTNHGWCLEWAHKTLFNSEYPIFSPVCTLFWRVVVCEGL